MRADAARGLREGGVGGPGGRIDDVFVGRREQGWVLRLVVGDVVRIETFSGDYVVLLHVRRAAIRHVFSDAEVGAATGRGWVRPRA